MRREHLSRRTEAPSPFDPPAPSSPAALDASRDATLEFATESSLARKAGPRAGVRPLGSPVVLTLIAIAAAAGVGALYWADRQASAVAATGSLRIESDPPGAEVRIDGALRGATPLDLTLPAGQYVVALGRGGQSKQLSVTVSGGVKSVHHIAWAQPVDAPAVSAGSLSVVSDLPGATVLVDGVERGGAPLTVSGLAPGQHEVVVRSQGAAHRRTVQVQAGSTTSLVVSAPGSLASPGWLSLATRVPLQVIENGRIVGTSEVDRIMLPAGEHEFEFVSEALGVRISQRVRIAAGQTTTLSVPLPRAPISINAVPWAEVFIDGTRVGDTPLANVMQTVGPHEIVFRHPQLGERRVTATVTLKEPARVSVDMRNQ